MPWMTPQDPPDDLRAAVACTWTATIEGTHQLVPDGCVDLVWLGSGGAWVCGPETAPWTFSLPPGLDAVGVRLRPGAARPALRCDVHELRDTRVPLEDLFGDGELRRWQSDLGDGSPPDRVAVALAAVRRWLAEGADADAVDHEIARVLSASPAAAIGPLADHVGLTPRQLHRRSLRAFGYPATTLARIMRFQRFVRAAHSSRAANDGAAPVRPVSLGVLAASVGYSDQSHLVRECRRLTGSSPSTYLSRYVPTFPRMSDPFKTVPEGRREDQRR